MMKIIRGFCACFVALVCASLALASNDTWKIATSGVWSTGTNWVDNSARAAATKPRSTKLARTRSRSVPLPRQSKIFSFRAATLRSPLRVA